MSELIDVVDVATGERIDTLPRDQVHAEGLWHHVFHCLVVKPSNAAIVLQERALTKAAFPGKLDLSVTGHLGAGETPLDGVREAEEELGVTVDPDRLHYVGVRLLADDNGEGHNRERVHLFFLADDRPLADYDPPSDEVSDLVEVKAVDFLAALADGDLAVPCKRRNSGPGRLRRRDLIEGESEYWATLGVMAERFLTGRRPIAI